MSLTNWQIRRITESTPDLTGRSRREWQEAYSLTEELRRPSPLRLVTPYAPVPDVNYRLQHLFRLLTTDAEILTYCVQHDRPIDGFDYRVLVLEEQMAHLRVRPDLFGDRAAVSSAAHASGIPAQVRELADLVSQKIPQAKEQVEVCKLRYNPAHRNFLALVKSKVYIKDSTRIWIDREYTSRPRIANFTSSIPLPNSSSEDEDLECTLCYGAISSDYVCTKCKHKFHGACLEAWVDAFTAGSNNNTCPSCRAVLFVSPDPCQPSPRLAEYLNLRLQLHESRCSLLDLNTNLFDLRNILQEVEAEGVMDFPGF
ncbi:hypothetical protein CC80DRAFT_499881 [Byssothecium circinans]|uniref:RING-type domain-containing protein n=1 Tax=Byssothecium circinans TaxID=147558 RepID=A0A6A5UBH1_9PLEO|nr:hypothetical protein CC80DRAFT_499881 [Byssothecium circinans]